MKIILSRKGVDSSAGGFASPILGSDRLLPMAIPDTRSPIRYRDLQSELPVGRLVKHLSRDQLNGWSRVHLDPDLVQEQLRGRDQFMPVFGQCGAAQTHLASHSVGVGDLFLFFGWFREVMQHRKRWRYVSNAPDLHVIFGWMQVAKVVPVDLIKQVPEYEFLKNHPHCFGSFSGHNTLYVGRRQLSFRHSIAGAGYFDRLTVDRTLTAAGCSRSLWQVPQWMHPAGRKSTLSYHQDISRWHRLEDKLQLQSVARGQEFVLDTNHYPEARDWVSGLFSVSA
jgi:hypothetical protein